MTEREGKSVWSAEFTDDFFHEGLKFQEVVFYAETAKNLTDELNKLVIQAG